MKDSVYVIGGRQLKLVRDLSDALRNLKGAKELVGKLMVGTWGEGRLHIRL